MGIHEYFLENISSGDNPLISKETAEEARRAWIAISLQYLFIRTPACTGPDGMLLYSWDKAEYHLELEFKPGFLPNFFYRNRITHEIWDVDWNIDQNFSEEIKEKLEIFNSAAQNDYQI